MIREPPAGYHEGLVRVVPDPPPGDNAAFGRKTMPLYEYQCEACAHRFEQIRKFSDPPLTSCPECGGTVRKLVSSPAIQFKGTGWYVTDYARQGKKDPGAAEAKAGSPAEGAGSKSEKPDGGKKADAGKPADSKGSSGTASSTPAKPAAAGTSS